MEALGRLFNIAPVADAVWINVKDCAAITFVGYLTGAAGDTYTLAEATTGAGAGAQALATVTRYFTCTGDGTDTWVLNTQAAASTVITAAAAAQNVCAFCVSGEELSATFDWLRVTSTGAGQVIAIPHDLTVQRTPANLLKLGV